MNLPLRGIIPPVVTPLMSDTTLDVQGLENLIEHLISGGVHGIFLLGTTGEAPNLDYRLRKEFIKKASTLIDHRTHVFVGITDTSFAGSLDLAFTAREAEADALVISAPYYLPMSQNELVEYFERIVPQLPLPFMLYNMPLCTKIHMSLSTVKKAKNLGAIGIKDSSGDLNYLFSLIDEFKDSPDFSIITGTEMFIPEAIMKGGHGAVPGGANIFPELLVDLYNASVDKNPEKIEILRDRLSLMEEKIYNIGKDASKYIKSIKCALSVMGICSDYVAMPFQKFAPNQKRRMEKNLKEMDLFQKSI